MSLQPDKYPELLADLIQIVGAVMTKHGMAPDTVNKAAFETAETVRARWGGAILYLPKGKEFMLTMRDLQIYDEFNGRNVRQLAKQYNLSDAQVYKIVQHVRAADVKRRQVDAFSAGE